MHWSPTVHGSPSSHADPVSGACRQPSKTSQRSSVHGFPSSQPGGAQDTGRVEVVGRRVEIVVVVIFGSGPSPVVVGRVSVAVVTVTVIVGSGTVRVVVGSGRAIA